MEEAMGVKALAHICIMTGNLEACEQFYCGILGFKKRFNFTRNGEIKGFYLEISRHNFIEFFEDKTMYAQKSAIAHFCLETGNILEMKKRLGQHSIDTTEIKLGCDSSYQFWFKDPNGIDVEFHQYTAKSSQRTGKDAEMDW